MNDLISTASLTLTPELRGRLQALCRRRRVFDIVIGLALCLGLLLALLALQAAADWWLVVPRSARFFLLLLDLGLIAAIYRKVLHPALFHPLTITAAARLVEEHWPGFDQRLLTLTSENGGNHNAGSPQLQRILREKIAAHAATIRFQEAAPVQRVLLPALLGGTIALAFALGTFFTWPDSAALLGRSILLPIPVPPKSLLVPGTADMVVAIGSDLALVAKGKRIVPQRAQVIVDTGGANIFAAPLQAPATFRALLPNVQKTFRYHFISPLGSGEVHTVRVKPSPILTQLAGTETFPPYTARSPREHLPSELNLLVGSHLRLLARTSADIAQATVHLVGLEKKIEMKRTGTGWETEIPVPIKGLTGLSIHLTDSDGLPSLHDTIFPIELLPDHPPDLKLRQPKQPSMTITRRAKPLFQLSARDDFGIKELSVECIVTLPTASSEAPPTTRRFGIPLEIHDRGGLVEYELPFIASEWPEGCVIEYWARAVDNNDVTGPGVSETRHQKFRIISLEQKEAELRRRLNREAVRIDLEAQEQGNVGDETARAVVAKSAAPPKTQQEGVARSIGRIQSNLQGILSEVELNRIDTLDPRGAIQTIRKLKDFDETILAPLTISPATKPPGEPPALAPLYEQQLAAVILLETIAADFIALAVERRILWHVEDLIVRQAANLRESTVLRDVPANRTPSHDAVVTARQTAIASEVDFLARTARSHTVVIRDASQIFTDETKRAVADGQWVSALKTAPQMIALGDHRGSLPHQKVALLGLENWLRKMLTTFTPRARWKEAKTFLDQLTADQKRLARWKEAKTFLDQLTADQKRLHEDALKPEAELPLVAARQGNLADRAELLRILLEGLNPEAGAEANRSRQHMDRAERAQTDLDQMSSEQEQATAALEAAQKLLANQLGSLPADGVGSAGAGQGVISIGEAKFGEGTGEGSGQGGTGQGDEEGNGNESGNGGNGTTENGNEGGAQKPPPEDFRPGQVIGGLNPKDREALGQFRDEKSPPDYAPLIEQYLRSLSEDETR